MEVEWVGWWLNGMVASTIDSRVGGKVLSSFLIVDFFYPWLYNGVSIKRTVVLGTYWLSRQKWNLKLSTKADISIRKDNFYFASKVSDLERFHRILFG